ncbi:hypothetical protein ACFFGH_28425 [Lysobacter korlensis]|uniref:Uncharacterized protein n=1 Tax=Lysobacter korlensis TaxID=553636 RepID=A0ABV6RXS8_9GAMM
MTVRYSWPQFGKPLKLSVISVSASGREQQVVDVQHARVHLEGLEGDWDTVALELELTADEELPSALVGAPLQAHALCSGPATNVRLVAPLALDAAGSWRGRLELARSQTRGVLQLQGFAVAADDTGRPLLRGASDTWSVVQEKGAKPEAPTAIPVRNVWIKFSDADAPTLCKEYPDATHFFVAGEEPVLYLNSDLMEFQVLLQSQKPQKEKRRLQDIFAATIAATVTHGLLSDAMQQAGMNAGDDESGVSRPDSPLLVQVCEAVAREMQGISDVEDFYKRMADARLSLSETARFKSELDLAVNRLVGLDQAIKTSAEEVR